jgi:restriction system protein
VKARDPEKISLTPDDIKMSSGSDLSKLYNSAAVRYDFPCPQPHWQFDTSPPPVLPPVKIPKKIEARLVAQNGNELTVPSDIVSKYYGSELDQVSAINSQAASLLDRLNQKNEVAKEASEFMEIHLGHAKLKFRDAEASLAREFAQIKAKYERDGEEAVGPILSTFAKYSTRDVDGIKAHFVLALCHLSLPLPADYPWDVFYKRDERLLQVNQCVPSVSDISVVRPDSKRPLAKRDVDAVLRRYVPAVALQVAHHLARNDLNDDVDRVAVNCWSRFFEPASGKLKEAFVAALTVDKSALNEIDLQRADALEAFRVLRGAYVYSTQDVVPIEPLIRLDKDDDRFVAGRAVLDGMAQGQNLSEMDWQDFEHLIREATGQGICG